MTFFLPSFFQKRILRYALSRLEFLDSNSLDLENLDIVWGKESVIELREVGIQIQKISALLQLPAVVVVTKAKISTLRVTVPSDLYKASILVAIHGIEIVLQIDEQRIRDDTPLYGRPAGLSKDANPLRHKGSDPKLHQGQYQGKHASFADDSEGDDNDHIRGRHAKDQDQGIHLPDTEAIAHSFLQSEPLREKAELQAAVSKSLHVAKPQVEDDSCEDSETGVGSRVSLPGFLADFLQGVADRMQFEIQDVKLDLEQELGSSAECLAESEDLDPSERVILRLSIGSIAIGSMLAEIDTPVHAPDGSSHEINGTGIRRVSLAHLYVMVLSEPSVFSTLARSTNPSSPESSHQTVSTAVKAIPSPLASLNENLNEATLSVKQNATPEASGWGAKAGDDHKSCFGTIGTRLDDVELDPPQVRKQGPSYRTISEEGMFHDNDFPSPDGGTDPHKRVPILPDQGFSPSQPTSFDDNVQTSASLQSHPTAAADIPEPRLQNQEIEMGSVSTAEGQSHPRSSAGKDEAVWARDPLISEVGQSPASSSPQSIDSVSPSEDLSESKIFSHEQATSMYMSAMTTADQGINSGSHEVPGGWQSSYSENRYPLEPSRAVSSSDASRTRVISQRESVTETEGRRDSSVPLVETYHHHYATSNRAIQASEAFVDSNSGRCSRKLPEDSAPDPSEGASILGKRIVSVDSMTLKVSRRRYSDSSNGASAPATLSETAVQGDGSENLHPVSSAYSTSFHKMEHAGVFISGPDRQSARLAYAITVREIEILGDIALTKLLIVIAGKVKTLLGHFPPSQDSESEGQSHAKDSYTTLDIHSISWSFLDVVKGSSDQERDPRSRRSSVDSEVLLKSHAKGISFTHEKCGFKSTSTASLGKFMLGYADQEILSFRSVPETTTGRGPPVPTSSDAKCTINQTSYDTFVDLSTQPILFTLDLRRLDETFSWFGGFSSMLGLGSSMISTVKPAEHGSKTFGQQRSATRKVQFDTSIAKSDREENRSMFQKKFTARAGGVKFDVLGTQCALCLDTTAIKLVSRSEGLGIQIDRMDFKASGVLTPEIDTAYHILLNNTRVEYLAAPKEVDISRLLALVAPSKDRYQRDDDIMFDRLLSQRKQGGVLRATIELVDALSFEIKGLEHFSSLTDDLRKLSKVAKYLPEDDRPGILILVLMHTIKADITLYDRLGPLILQAREIELAHVATPHLTAFSTLEYSLFWHGGKQLLGQAVPTEAWNASDLPMIMGRFVGNAMEPTLEIKIHNTCFDYHTVVVIDILALDDNMAESIVTEIVGSVATITSKIPHIKASKDTSKQIPTRNETSLRKSPAARLDITIKHSIIGLNPLGSSAKCLAVLADTHFIGDTLHEGITDVNFVIKRASIMVIDDTHTLIARNTQDIREHVHASPDSAISALESMGYVIISRISAANARLKIFQPRVASDAAVDIEITDELFVFESCADSTQTFLDIVNGLKPPTSANTELKYKTSVVPVEDMLASFSGDAYGVPGRSRARNEADDAADCDYNDTSSDDSLHIQDSMTDLFDTESMAISGNLAGSMLSGDYESLAMLPVSGSADVQIQPTDHAESSSAAQGYATLDFQEDHFNAASKTGYRVPEAKSNPAENMHGKNPIRSNPLKIRVRDVHIIWNLFDGYDWQHTRQTISKAVAEVQNRASERSARREPRQSSDMIDKEDHVVGDFLFNSIYIALPAKSDPADLTRMVNHNIDDLASEAESHDTSFASSSPTRLIRGQKSKSRPLRLQRSKHHKMTFELKGVAADVTVLPPGLGEVESLLDVRVHDLEIFDHVPTSTWKKFATYMQDAGEREYGTSMIHLEIQNVRPVPNLAASEVVIKASILPLRLHVDQDALDFLTRFFEFKDESKPSSQNARSEAPFIQRAEVMSVRLKLDFKPKRVDYAGLRSGRTNEMMNFFILDSADMILRHAIIYGISGFDRLGKTLNDIWMPDIKHNQLPGVLAGLAPVRSVVNVGSGVRDLIVVPIQEYRKDGRIVRSFQKGALAFAKTTTSELMRLGAKLAIGTQTVLQGAEDVLSHQGTPHIRSATQEGWDEDDLDEAEKKRVSLYADQPIGVFQGLRGAYACLEQDLLMARDAVVAMPGEVMESGSSGGAAKAVLRRAPTIILRPAMGVSRAVGQTLIGATNSVDPEHRRRAEDKYKRH